MATNNVSAPPPATHQQVDPNDMGVNINISKDSHPINIDLAVQVIFLQYNQMMNLRTQDKLDQTKATLQQMSDARDMYNRMKTLKQEAQDKGKGGTTDMPKDMQDFLDAHGVSYDTTGNDNVNSSDEWDINMTDLDSYLQKISGQNKTQMLELNQSVEEGNNSLREVTTVFAKHTEIIQSIIQTINR